MLQFFMLLLSFVLLVACDQETVQPEQPRPVRYMEVQARSIGDTAVFTGQLLARDEIRQAFLLSGKMVERLVDVGDIVHAGQVIARLEAETQQAAANAADADYVASQAVLEQAKLSEKRLADLLKENAVALAEYEAALRQLKTAKARVDAAKARQDAARDQLGYTILKSEADGIITANGAEPGEVVAAGQMIATLARRGGRDAIFDIPAQIIVSGIVTGQKVELWLADNPLIKAVGQIREIAPQADPFTRTYQIKVKLLKPPGDMLLGSVVVGRMTLGADELIAIPSSSLTTLKEAPAVWVINQSTLQVQRRPITIARYIEKYVLVAGGLQPGEKIVTAGANTLHDGQVIRLLEARKNAY